MSHKNIENVVMMLFVRPVPSQTRHRAVNLFLQGYEKSWIEAEEHYFEDKLIEDLAVSSFQCTCGEKNCFGPWQNFSHFFFFPVCAAEAFLIVNVCSCQKPGAQEPSEEEEGMKHIDPLHQLIQLFSRTALTEKWWVLIDICNIRASTKCHTSLNHRICL